MSIIDWIQLKDVNAWDKHAHMANSWVRLGLGQVIRVAGQKRAILNELKTDRINRVVSQVRLAHIFHIKKNQINVNFLERMNQIK